MHASWFAISLGVAVVVLGSIIVFAVAQPRRPRTADEASTVTVTYWVAVAWATMSVIGAIASVLAALMQPEVTITVPVQEFWPALPTGTLVEGTTASRAGGGFTSAEVNVAGLSVGARVLWAVSQGVAWLLPAAIAGLLAVACRQLRTGRAFAPVVSKMAMITAVVVAVGGLTMQITGDIAGNLAAVEVLQWTGAQYPDVAGIEDELQAWWPQPGFGVTFPFWPLAAGLGFAALAAVFRAGSRLQHDTEGLV